MAKSKPSFFVPGELRPLERSAHDLELFRREWSPEWRLKGLKEWAEEILRKSGLPTDLRKAATRNGRKGFVLSDESVVKPGTVEHYAVGVLWDVERVEGCIRNGDAGMAALFAMNAASKQAAALMDRDLAERFFAGAASHAGAIRGGNARRDPEKDASLAADLAAVEGEHPGQSDAEYSRMIARRRGAVGTAAVNKAARKLATPISRLRKKPVTTGAT